MFWKMPSGRALHLSHYILEKQRHGFGSLAAPPPFGEGAKPARRARMICVN
jgi:hypothetical protein